MSTPRNSAEVAIKLLDYAHKLGLSAKLESSLVSNSDSRYLILNPHKPSEAVIRISSHPPFDNSRYGLALDVHKPRRRESAVRVGMQWIEDYANSHSEIKTVARGEGLASAGLLDAGSGGDRHSRERKPNGIKRRNRYGAYGPVRGNPRRLRNANTFSERYGLKGYLRHELAGDD